MPKAIIRVWSVANTNPQMSVSGTWQKARCMQLHGESSHMDCAMVTGACSWCAPCRCGAALTCPGPPKNHAPGNRARAHSVTHVEACEGPAQQGRPADALGHVSVRAVPMSKRHAAAWRVVALGLRHGDWCMQLVRALQVRGIIDPPWPRNDRAPCDKAREHLVMQHSSSVLLQMQCTMGASECNWCAPCSLALTHANRSLSMPVKLQRQPGQRTSAKAQSCRASTCEPQHQRISHAELAHANCNPSASVRLQRQPCSHTSI